MHKLDAVMNRLVIALVVTGGLIGSSLIGIFADERPARPRRARALGGRLRALGRARRLAALGRRSAPAACSARRPPNGRGRPEAAAISVLLDVVGSVLVARPKPQCLPRSEPSWPRISPPRERSSLWTFAYAKPSLISLTMAAMSPAARPCAAIARTSAAATVPVTVAGVVVFPPDTPAWRRRRRRTRRRRSRSAARSGRAPPSRRCSGPRTSARTTACCRLLTVSLRCPVAAVWIAGTSLWPLRIAWKTFEPPWSGSASCPGPGSPRSRAMRRRGSARARPERRT